MKKLFFFGILTLLSTNSIFSQAPKAFKYQAVIRDTAGIFLSEQLVSMKMSILKGDINADAIYSEIHDVWTNKLGLISLEIGNGYVVGGEFSEIQWGQDIYFVQTEIDLSGGTDYSFLGASQFLAVPYALYAETSGDVLWKESDEGIYYNDGSVGIGTDKPSAMLEVKAPAVFGDIFGYEVLFKGQVSDASNDFFKIHNGTLYNNQMIPFLWGHHESDKRLALGLMGTVTPETDYGDSAVMVFSSRVNTGGGGMEWGHVLNRPLFEWWNLAEPMMTMSAEGKLGIGVKTPSAILDVRAPAISGTTEQTEVFFNAEVSDAPVDFFRILNGTFFNNQMMSFLWGHHESDKRVALGLMGTIKAETDFGDSAVMVFSSRVNAGGMEWEQVLNRPLFEWWNLAEPKMTMSANGNLGIGVTEPQRTLHVNDVLRLEPRATPPDNPSEGDIYMDSSDHVLMVFDGTEWQSCW